MQRLGQAPESGLPKGECEIREQPALGFHTPLFGYVSRLRYELDATDLWSPNRRIDQADVRSRAASSKSYLRGAWEPALASSIAHRNHLASSGPPINATTLAAADPRLPRLSSQRTRVQPDSQ